MIKELIKSIFGKKKKTGFDPYTCSLVYFQMFAYNRYTTVYGECTKYIQDKAEDVFYCLHNSSFWRRSEDVGWYLQKIGEMVWHFSTYFKEEIVNEDEKRFIKFIFSEFENLVIDCKNILCSKGDEKEEIKEIMFYRFMLINEILRNKIGRDNLKCLYLIIFYITKSYCENGIVDSIKKVMEIKKTDEEKMVEIKKLLNIN